MAPVLLLLALAQTPDAGGEPEPIIRVIPVPMPPEAQPAPPPQPAPAPQQPVIEATPVPAPVQQPPPPEPVVPPRPAVIDAGVLPPPPPLQQQPVPLPAPAPVSPYAYEYDAGIPVAPPPAGLVFRAGIESGLTSWPEGNPQDLWLFARPIIGLEAGESFAAELGATFNLLVFDDPPVNRPYDIGGFLRHDDWDEPSDFGQIIRLLKLGKSDSKVWARAGAVRLKTLGNGHLINRYSNQDAPNYHPSSGNAGFLVGPVKGEFFASDIFGARIFSGLAGIEFGRLLASDPKWFDRFWLSLEIAHDAGSAGGPLLDPVTHARLNTPSASLLHLDLSIVMFKSPAAQVQFLAGAGSRISNRADFGAVLGLSADGDLGSGFLLGGKVEVRKQAGGFRQGFFGPQYELSRFAGAGFSGVPIADQLLPDGFSFYGELRIGSRGFIVAEGAIEHFLWGRTDVDASLQAEFLDSRVVTIGRFAAIALGASAFGFFPRYSITAEARVRVFKSFYVMGSGGTVFLPQTDGSLRRGVQITAGVGLDFETGVNFN